MPHEPSVSPLEPSRKRAKHDLPTTQSGSELSQGDVLDAPSIVHNYYGDAVTQRSATVHPGHRFGINHFNAPGTLRDDRKHGCNLCPSKSKFFATQYDVLRHQKSVHGVLSPGDRIWICRVDRCQTQNKIWPRLDNFKGHLARMRKDQVADDAESMEEEYDPVRHGKMEVMVRSSNRYHLSRSPVQRDDASPASNNIDENRPEPSTEPSVASLNTPDRQRLGSSAEATPNPNQSVVDEENVIDLDNPHSEVCPVPNELLACPFYKVRPTKNQRCGVCILRTPAAVKQHLARKHLRPTYYCHRCSEVFENSRERDEHLIALSCKVQTSRFEDMMDHEVFRQINQKRRNESHSEFWFRIFTAIFPGQALPASAYQDNEIDAWHTKALAIVKALGPVVRTSLTEASIDEIRASELLSVTSKDNDTNLLQSAESPPTPSSNVPFRPDCDFVDRGSLLVTWQ